MVFASICKHTSIPFFASTSSDQICFPLGRISLKRKRFAPSNLADNVPPNTTNT